MAQSAPTLEVPTYKVYTEHPRLFLRPARLKLLRRERERKSLRWDQFQTLAGANAPFPEPGIANALYYQISGDKTFGRKAVDWALTAKDQYQVALVYDWCLELLTAAEKARVEAALGKAMNTPGKTLDAAKTRLLAAIALESEAGVQRFFEQDWTPRMKELRDGHNVISREETFSLYEIMHAIQDNLQVDLRESYPKYFKELPLIHLMTHYPAPFPAAESEYRIPMMKNLAEPDLERAALSRVAELEMVAFDSNAPESQVLQGWLMNDRFLMRGMFGIPYEMLWANPYQPGLSYYHVPLVYHDEMFGRLFARSVGKTMRHGRGSSMGSCSCFRTAR